LSPSQDTPAEVFAALDKHGEVASLIAPGGHDLGIPEWQARYPNAQGFAPTNTLKQLAKKRGLRPFRPLAEMKVERSDVTVVDLPGAKTGSAFVRAGNVAYVDEIVGNNERLPPSKPFALFFWLTGSAPGLKVNGVYTMLFCSDKRALARAALAHLDGVETIAFAHGPPLRGAQASSARALIAGLA